MRPQDTLVNELDEAETRPTVLIQPQGGADVLHQIVLFTEKGEDLVPSLQVPEGPTEDTKSGEADFHAGRHTGQNLICKTKEELVRAGEELHDDLLAVGVVRIGVHWQGFQNVAYRNKQVRFHVLGNHTVARMVVELDQATEVVKELKLL